MSFSVYEKVVLNQTTQNYCVKLKVGSTQLIISASYCPRPNFAMFDKSRHRQNVFGKYLGSSVVKIGISDSVRYKEGRITTLLS